MNTISYFVFGNKREYQLELSFSVLSAVRYLRADPADVRLVLITEEGKRRPDLPIEHVHFSNEEFQSWSQGGANVHRVKEFALLKVLNTYGGAVAHVDPDTFFVAHPRKLFERISERASVMHEDEHPLSADPVWKPFLDTAIRELDGYEISPQSRMFNSGVIGIHHVNRHLLMEAVALEDKLYAITPAFSAEQFATGTVLAKHTHLTGCADVIEHYWGHRRPFIHAQCARLFPEFTQEIFEQLASAPSLPCVGVPKIALMDKIAARLRLGSRAKNDDYWFAQVACLSALRCAQRDPTYANAWTEVAVDCLRHLRDFDPETWAKYRGQFSSDFDFVGKEARGLPLNGNLRDQWAQFWPTPPSSGG